MPDLTPIELAQLFHETYERLAPDFGYRTREASAKPWADVPAANRDLMVATCFELLTTVRPRLAAETLRQAATNVVDAESARYDEDTDGWTACRNIADELHHRATEWEQRALAAGAVRVQSLAAEVHGLLDGLVYRMRSDGLIPSSDEGRGDE